MIFRDSKSSFKQLPTRHTFLSNSCLLPSKLNIKLKTHSLVSLDVPLDTLFGFKQAPLLVRDKCQRTLAGSVDLISETQQQLSDKKISCCSSYKPLINISSTNKQISSSEREYRQVIEHRCRIPNPFITTASMSDSVARLRRSHQLQNIHQASLQAMQQTTDKRHRLSHSRTHNYNLLEC